jgi:hypothetical protein
MNPVVLFFAVIMTVPIVAIISNAIIRYRKIELEKSPISDISSELSGVIKDEFSRLRKENGEFRKRLENLESIVTSSVWDQKTRGTNAPHASTLTDTEQAEWLAKQINAEQNRS